MFQTRVFFFKSFLVLAALECAILTTINAKVKLNELSEIELAHLCFNLMIMLELKLNRGDYLNQTEIDLMIMLIFEIQKRMDLETSRLNIQE